MVTSIWIYTTEKYQSFEPQDEYSMLTLGFDMIRADVSSSMNELKSLDLMSVSDNELKVLSKEEVYSSGVFIEHPDPLGLIEDNDTLACYNITSVYLPQLQEERPGLRTGTDADDPQKRQVSGYRNMV